MTLTDAVIFPSPKPVNKIEEMDHILVDSLIFIEK